VNPVERIRQALVVSEAQPDARVLLAARGTRAFGDGFVSVLLPLHLTGLGFSSFQVGVVATSTLLGSAALTLLIGLIAYRLKIRQLLIRATMLMIATGIGFAFIDSFWPLLVVAFTGTLNPSAGDVSVFLPTEQSLLSRTVPGARRTALFARYSLVGSLVAALGSLASGFPEWVEKRTSIELATAIDGMFLLYAGLGVVALLLYNRLSSNIEPAPSEAPVPLKESKAIVYRLAALFSLDSFAGGFVVQSMLALWLFERFDLSITTTGTIFFFTNLLAACSYLASSRLAARIGLINTMVYTHLPANLFLIAAAFMPRVELAVACLLLRSMLSNMDAPARTSYVMAVVTPQERTAAASITNVPRSLASAVGPSLSGWMLGMSTFGWPLIIAGSLKATYDLILLHMFRQVRPPEEE
jgi:MFS family permease